jgi:hypothetical protein
MYNDINALEEFLIDMAHDVEVEDEELAEDLQTLAETLS